MTAAVIALLVALPALARLLPAGGSSVRVATLLSRIQASAAVPWSGFAQTTGGLALPVSDRRFGAIADLLGGQKRARVWWRSPASWRVDQLTAVGETDNYRDAGGYWRFDYESNVADRIDASLRPRVRAPRTDDLVPAMLARRLLSTATPSAVSRLPSRRVAGTSAAGVRLTVHDPRSTITHVDVWALPDTGLAVQVEVYGRATTPVVSSVLLDLSTARPAPRVVTFRPGPGVRVESEQATDLVDAIDRYSGNATPRRLAGFGRRNDIDLGSVGVYGDGLTVLVAVPLSGHLADELAPRLAGTGASADGRTGTVVAAGPLNLVLSPPGEFGARWLLVGTVTAKALRAAVPALPSARGFEFGFGR